MKISIALILIILGLIIFFICNLRKIDNFTSAFKIISDHFKMFNGVKKHIFIIYGSPLILVIGLSMLYTFPINIVEIIIIIALIFMILLLVFQTEVLNIKPKSRNAKELLIEVNNSISFAVCIDFILMFIALFYLENAIFTAIISYLLLIIFLTILIILKRIKTLIKLNY